jgi:hypothetical protein
MTNAKYKVGEKVWVVNDDMELVEAEIVSVLSSRSSVLFTSEYEYGVLMPFQSEAVYLSEWEIDLYMNNNQYTSARKCECGADRLGHPGHSSFCPKF